MSVYRFNSKLLKEWEKIFLMKCYYLSRLVCGLPRMIAPQLELGIKLGLGLVLEFGAISYGGNCPRARSVI